MRTAIVKYWTPWKSVESRKNQKITWYYGLEFIGAIEANNGNVVNSNYLGQLFVGKWQHLNNSPTEKTIKIAPLSAIWEGQEGYYWSKQEKGESEENSHLISS